MDNRIKVNVVGKWEMWEAGGGMTNTGNAQIICGPHGEELKPVFVRTGGDRACKEHAKFLVSEGDVVVTVTRHRQDFIIVLERIQSDGTLTSFYRQEEGEITLGSFDDTQEEFSRAVYAAWDKAECYHCREPHYMVEGLVAGGSVLAAY